MMREISSKRTSRVDFGILHDERGHPPSGSPGIRREAGQFDGCEFSSTWRLKEAVRRWNANDRAIS